MNKQRNFTTLISGVLLLTMSCSVAILYGRSSDRNIHIVPKPNELIINNDSFQLNNDVAIEYAPSMSKTARYLAAKLKASTGFRLFITPYPALGTGKRIRLMIDSAMTNVEGYNLKSTKNGIDIKASGNTGAFYGVQSLLQLFPAEIESQSRVKGVNWTISCVAINDYPRFSYRGVMLDVCRHFFDVATVKQQIELMAMLKINKLHLHLTENQSWRIEIKKYPQLTKIGAISDKMDGDMYGPYYYTQKDLKEIVEYASRHHIEVIPEIEFPGHTLAALATFPELSCTGGPFYSRLIFGFERDVFCIGNEKVFEFMENVLLEVAAIFPSKYIHIGGDECAKERWKACVKCQVRINALALTADDKHSAEEKLQSYAIKRIEQFVSSKLNKKIIGWDEILEGGLAPGSTVMSWRGVKGGVEAANKGHDIIMASMPDGYYMCDYQGAPEVEIPASGLTGYLNKTYDFDPVPQEVPKDKIRHILGLQVCMWSEWALNKSIMEEMLYPRTIAMSEVGWTEPANKNYSDFYNRMNALLFRFDLKGINYHIPHPEGVLTRNVLFDADSVVLRFTNTGNLPMVYTLDKSIPHRNSLVFKDSLIIRESTELNIVTLLPSGKTGKVRTIPVEKAIHKPALTGVDTTGNVRLRIAAGRVRNDNDYKKITFTKDTLITSISEYGNGKFDYSKPSVAIYEGSFYIPQDGIYTFSTQCEKLSIDNELIVRNTMLARELQVKKQVSLQKGRHSYRLIFNNTVVEGFANCWYPVNFQYTNQKGKRTIIQ